MKKNQTLKTKILFAHSGGAQYGPGKGSYDLVKYLRARLKDEYQILFPLIEKPNSPAYSKFKTMFDAEFAKLTGPVILVGHSLGSSTLLKYLSEEKPDIPVLGIFLVATPHWKSNMKEFQLKPNFQASLKQIPAMFFYHSMNDKEVPAEHLSFYENAFKTAVVRKLKGSEHVFSKGLPQLVKDIRSL